MKRGRYSTAGGAGGYLSSGGWGAGKTVTPAGKELSKSLRRLGQKVSMSDYGRRDGVRAFAQRYLRLCFVAGRVPSILNGLERFGGVPAHATMFGAKGMESAVALVVDFEGMLATLPDQERFAFALLALLGLRDWEAARVLGLSPHALSVVYGRACERLLGKLVEGGYGKDVMLGEAR